MICNYLYFTPESTPTAILGPVDASYSVQLIGAGSIWITTDSGASMGSGNGAAQVPNSLFTVVLHEGDTLYAMSATSSYFSFVAVPVS